MHDDLLRLSMSSAIMHLSRIFFFDEMGGADLCSALRNPPPPETSNGLGKSCP